MSNPQTVLILAILMALAACTVVQLDEAQDEDEVFTRPKPVYPDSEGETGREGWVMVAYAVDRGGLVSGVEISDTSGNDAFEQAALDAVREWRYAPGDPRELTVLLSFVYDRQVVQLSRRFVSLNKKVHASIESGDLEAAEALLAEIRSDDDLTVYELAYSFLTEGRIAASRGDRAGQLASFRKAMLLDGRWLARDNYLSCLQAVIFLEIEQGDYVSALRDYDILTETRVGRKLAADLEGSIQAIRSWIESVTFEQQPFLVADSNVSVTRERSRPNVSLIRIPEVEDPETRPPPTPNP